MKKIFSILCCVSILLIYTNTIYAQCAITDVILIVADCDNNGTPTDPSDDFYTFQIEVSYINAGTTFTVTNGATGAVLVAGQAYSNPVGAADIVTFTVPAGGQDIDIVVTDDADAACTFSTGILGALLNCSNCTIFSGSSVTGPVCEGAVEGIFTVTVGSCDIAPGGTFTSALVMYDVDVTNAPPTNDDLYNDLIGAIDAPDLIWFGESGDCANSGDLSDLEGFENPSCTPLEIDLYIVPADLIAGLISFDCPIEGPILLTTLPAEPSYITSCATGELIAGIDNGDGFGGPPDGDFDDPEDEICGSKPFDFSACPTPPTASYTAADLGALFGNDGSCYNDGAPITCTCPCDSQAPSIAITGATCADGSMGAPYVVGDDGTGQLSTGDIIEYIVVDNAAGTATGVPDAIISIGSLAEAQATADATSIGSEVCITAIVHSPTQLNQIFTDLETCTNGLVSQLLGITAPLQSLEQLYDGLIFGNGGVNPNLTLADVEGYVGGSGGGPGNGGAADIGVLAGLPPGILVCDVPPFCYNFLSATCATINDECPVIENAQAMITDPCNCNNGIDLDGDGINDLASETITITDPSGANQGWALTNNDNLVDADGTTPTTATVTDVGNATYTFTAYVPADGSTTYTAEFTAADGEVLTISGGPCNMCPPPLDEVPTVGEWGLIILALLMSITAVVGIRQRKREEAVI